MAANADGRRRSVGDGEARQDSGSHDSATESEPGRGPLDIDYSKPLIVLDAEAVIDSPAPLPSVEWAPPLPLDDETGFGSSEQVYCSVGGGTADSAVWSDGKSIWTSVVRRATLDGDLHGPAGGELSFHDGTGWHYLATTEPAYLAIGRFTDNRVALWDIEIWSNDDPCSLATIERDSGELACEVVLLEASVVDVFGVDDDLAYYADEQEVYRVATGTTTETLFEVDGRGLLWASQDAVVHATVDGPTVTVFEGEEVTTLPSVPVGTVSDVWATASDDIWLAGTSQLRHWDGSAWEIVSTSLDACEDRRIVHLWGEGGVVHAGGRDSVGRIENDEFTTVVSWCEDETAAHGSEPTNLGGLWGMAGGDDLLLWLRPMQEGVRGRRCMDLVLVLYDGSTYRRI